MTWDTPLPPGGNTDSTTAGGGYHADQLHNRTRANLVELRDRVDEKARSTALDIREFGADATGASSSAQALRDALDSLPTDPNGTLPLDWGATEGRGEVVLSGGTFLIDSTIDVMRFQRVRIAKDAIVVVPAGFSSTLFRFFAPNDSDRLLFSSIQVDGHIREAPTAQRLWTAFEWLAEGKESGLKGMSWAFVEGRGSVYFPGTAFLFRTTWDDVGTGEPYITSCGVTGLTVYYPNIVWDWQPHENRGFIRSNEFRDVRVQADATFTHGVRNLRGARNTWSNCTLWDLPSGAVSMQLASNAIDTVIVGGRMTDADFVDGGVDTLIFDGERGIRRGPSVIDEDVSATGVSVNAARVILLLRIADGQSRRINGTLRGHKLSSGSRTSTVVYDIAAGQNASDGGVHASVTKTAGGLHSDITTRRLVEVDHGGARWLGLELSGTATSSYPERMRFTGNLDNAAVPRAVLLSETSNLSAHTADAAYGTGPSYIDGTGEHKLAAAT